MHKKIWTKDQILSDKFNTYFTWFKKAIRWKINLPEICDISNAKNSLFYGCWQNADYADFWRTFGGLSKILKNDVIGYGHLQLHFQKCSFRKCKSQKCKNKKNSQKTKKSFVRSWENYPFESVFFMGTHFLKV